MLVGISELPHNQPIKPTLAPLRFVRAAYGRRYTFLIGYRGKLF